MTKPFACRQQNWRSLAGQSLGRSAIQAGGDVVASPGHTSPSPLCKRWLSVLKAEEQLLPLQRSEGAQKCTWARELISRERNGKLCVSAAATPLWDKVAALLKERNFFCYFPLSGCSELAS